LNGLKPIPIEFESSGIMNLFQIFQLLIFELSPAFELPPALAGGDIIIDF
jgi:hypothetical protein